MEKYIEKGGGKSGKEIIPGPGEKRNQGREN